jgi:hypothetical protein
MSAWEIDPQVEGRERMWRMMMRASMMMSATEEYRGLMRKHMMRQPIRPSRQVCHVK